MVQIIPAAQSFGSEFAKAFGGGISSGFSEARKLAQQSESNKGARELAKELTGHDISDPAILKEVIAAYSKEQAKNQKFEKYAQLLGIQSPNMGDQLQAGAMESEPSEEKTGGFDVLNMPDENIALAEMMGFHGLRQMKDAAIKRQEREQDITLGKEKEYFKLNEPKVMQLADSLGKMEMQELRYNKLEDLFSDPSKLPSSLTAAVFTKDGHINDVVYSQLTPEAQEAIKLIIDSTEGIKETYGARITNFELGTYLKKLPSLLNSPEGKQRVLRDLQIMNKINQLHAKGLMEVFDEAGGTDKIPFSRAENLYKKKYAKEEKALKDMFMTPSQKVFSDRPAPQKYLGKKIKDSETGEVFISNGNEWVPFKG